MKYKKFTITNYKGIPSIELDLDKKPTSNIFTLVGLNESGKTSVLGAINLFQHDIEKKDAHTLIPKSKQYGFNGSISIKADLELSDKEVSAIQKHLEDSHKFFLSESDKTVTIEKKYTFSKSVPLDTDEWKKSYWTINFSGKTKRANTSKKLTDWNKDAWQGVVNMIRDNYLPKILYYEDFLFKFPEKIYLEQFDNESEEQEEYRGVIQDILESIGPGLTAEEDLLGRMKNKREKSQKEALDQLLLKMSSKLNDEILKKWDEIFEGTQRKEVIVEDDSEVVGDTTRYFIGLKIKQGSDSYSINDRSLGFRWFFSFLIFTAFRKSRSSDPGETLFLLDEPASNLHQRSQQKLLLALENIVSNCKLVYSTHSHHLINPKWLAGTYIVRNKAIKYDNPEESDTTETDIDAILYKNFVADYPNEEDHFKPILDALQYTPSKLEVVPYTVFTEGKNDYYTFKYLADVIFGGKYNLNFYPGAGKDKYDDPFRLYLAWNRDFIALFDSDKGGHDAKRRYLKEIGSDLENKIFTLEEVDNKWKQLETEDLFSSDAEKVRIIQTCFEDYDKNAGYNKSKFNTAIQQLYMQNQKVELNKPTLEKFQKIFEFLGNKTRDVSHGT